MGVWYFCWVMSGVKKKNNNKIKKLWKRKGKVLRPAINTLRILTYTEMCL